MYEIIENVFRKLLIELKNVAGNAPNTDSYYATQYANGYVGYYDLKKSEHGDDVLVSLDPSDPNRFLRMINGQHTQKIETNPELKDAADQLVKLGFLTIHKYNEKHKDITSKNNRDIFPTPNDVPDITQKYFYNYDGRDDNTLKVDHTNKLINLDKNYSMRMPRRTDPGKYVGGMYRGPSYVIPSGDVAFANNELGLQKMLRFLMRQDPRLTSGYKIVGDEKYRAMTVGQLLKKPEEKQTALTGRGKIVMFHGTSEKRWNTIKKLGLRPNSGGDVYFDMIANWSEHNVYLTFNHANAENYATRQAIKDNSNAIVLKVEIPDASKLVADEDVFDVIKLDRPYRLQISYSNREHESEIVQGEISIKDLMFAFAKKRIKMDDEGEKLYKRLMDHIRDLSKKSLKRGVIAYRGMIPPKFIKPDMIYSKTPFKTPEEKGGPSDKEYDKIRTGVQKSAIRFDESAIHSFVRNVLTKNL